MSGEIVDLAGKFGLSNGKVYPIQNGVYRLVTANKHYCLKRMPVSEKVLVWMDRSLLLLRKKGFRRLAWRDSKTKAGRRLFARIRPGGSPYILTPWVNGRWPSPRSASDLRACGRALARFHLCAKGIAHRRPPAAANMVRRWPATYRMQAAMMSKFAKQHQSRSSLQRLVHEAQSYATDARRLLFRVNYDGLRRTHPHLITLCHGDGGPSNFIMNRTGLHLIDFETLRLDFRAYDLYRVIYNSCKDHDWKFSIAKHILDGYQEVQNLGRIDIELLKSLLRFPQTAYLTIRTLRHMSRQNGARVEKELSSALVQERRVTGFLKKLDPYKR